ncbi:MAG: recombinase family protein [Alphaproteobacteria bacterium]|nr:recombinase family protein [Alphaproteobacteria bacterium]
MRPAVILARVSSAEQEAGHSLEAQLSNLQEYAERHDLEVIQVFRIIESSTKGHRPEFERLIEFIGKQKQRTALIVDCVDRLQRSFTHTPVLNALMEKNLLEIHFVREGNFIDKDANSMQKLMWNMGTVMAQSYTDQLTDNVRRSIKHKLDKGEWIAQAPLGYLNSVDKETGRNTVILDPQRAALVQRLFYEYAIGVSSMTELRDKTNEWGLLSRKNKPLGLQTVAGILSNPFYCGLMRIKGHLYPHTYPQLVEHNVFRACEKRKRNANMPQQAIKKTRHPFLLRGLITCASSGRKATCALQKGRYVYLMARDPNDKDKVLWVKEDVVIEQIMTVLRSFSLHEDLLVDVIDYIRRSHEAEKEMHMESLRELRAESSNLTIKLNRLTDLLIEGHIEPKLYDLKHQEMFLRQRELGCILNDNHSADDKFKEALSNVIKLVGKTYDLFGSSNTAEKRSLLGFVFSNLKLEGPTLRYTLRKPFDVFAKLPNNPEWRPLRDSNPCYYRERVRKGTF